MLTLLLAAAGFAAAPDYPVTLYGGLGGSVGPPSMGGYAVGRAIFYPPRSPVGVEFGGREGYFVRDQRTVGGIAIQARAPLGPAFLRGGFLHHHEVPWDLASAHPVQAGLGSLEGIRHRSGLELGGGVDLTLPERLLDDRLGIVLDLSVSAFPDDHGPVVYVCLEQGWTIDVGPKRK